MTIKMKQLFKFVALAFSALIAFSCSRELTENEGNEPQEPESHIVNFTASYDNGQDASTKVDIDIDETTNKAKVSFTAGDCILIWDGDRASNTVILEEKNINPDGSASFSVNVSSGTGKYYALALDSPYLSPVTGSGLRITTSNSAYNDIAKGRIPHAAWAQCSSNETQLSFKNSFTLFKYCTASEDAATVTFTGNNDENVSGCVQFAIYNDKNGAASLFDYEKAQCYVYKSLISRVTGWWEDSWFALPPGITFSKGFTLTVKDSNGDVLTQVTTKKSFTTVAGQLWDLGILEGSGMTPYELWQAGYSFKVGGIKYNKIQYGDATLVEDGGEARGRGVFFIKDSAYVKPEIVSGGNALYISNNPFTRAKLIVPESSSTKTLYFGSPKLLAFNKIEIETPANDLLIDSTTTQTIDTLVFDNCKVTMHNGILKRNSSQRSLKVLNIVDSDFVVDIDDDKLDNSYIVNTGKALSGDDFTFDCITVKNNVFWSSKPREFRIIRSDGIVNRAAVVATDVAKAVSTKKLYIDNNTFYNVDNGEHSAEYQKLYRPFFMLGTVSGDLSIKSNLIYSTLPYEKQDDGSIQSTAREANILKCYFDTSADNIVGKLSSMPSWYGLNSNVCLMCFCRNGSDTPLRTTYVSIGHNELTEDPFDAIDMSEGFYSKKDEYADYGADR